MTEQKFAPGFRLSSLDVAVLAVGGTAAVSGGISGGWIGPLIAYVIGHFFLFCNVFRIARASELLWAFVFILLAASTIVVDYPSWTVTILVSLCVTVLIILWELRRASYHGVAWQRINPGLQDWWSDQRQSESTVT